MHTFVPAAARGGAPGISAITSVWLPCDHSEVSGSRRTDRRGVCGGAWRIVEQPEWQAADQEGLGLTAGRCHGVNAQQYVDAHFIRLRLRARVLTSCEAPERRRQLRMGR